MPASGSRVNPFAPLAFSATGLRLVCSVTGAKNRHDAPVSLTTRANQPYPRDKTPPTLALSEPQKGTIVEVRQPSHLLPSIHVPDWIKTVSILITHSALCVRFVAPVSLREQGLASTCINGSG